MKKCNICPRNCGADRQAGERGVCGTPHEYAVAKTMLHLWEEPCIAGEKGAGTVFFAGCNLHCVYCQNREISGGACGSIMTEEELTRAVFDLVEQGAASIELVTPTHYTHRLASWLEKIKPDLAVPVVWNSSGYEKAESLKMLEGLIDVYLPDFKYYDSNVARQYSHAPNYLEWTTQAVKEMLRQTGKPSFDQKGGMTGGVLIRHLVLPGHRQDSCKVLGHIARQFGTENVKLSLMSQYTPDFYLESGCAADFKNLGRRLTAFEYESVQREALRLGFDGYFQDSRSADKKYTPDFS